MNDSLLTLEQVAKMLQISERTVLRLVEKNELDAFKIGRSWRFERTAITAYIENQRKKTQEE